jgi:hypothetical protein
MGTASETTAAPAEAFCLPSLRNGATNGGLLVQVRGLDCVSGEPNLQQDSGVFMGIEQGRLKRSLPLFLSPTKYR